MERFDRSACPHGGTARPNHSYCTTFGQACQSVP
nr:MAG TPA: hypothetical protein [Caudoviricetes sp.]